MTYELTTYGLIYLGAAIICAIASPFVWLRREAPGFLWLFLALAAMIIWNLSDMMEQTVVELQGHIFWSQVSYFGGPFLGVFLVLFALEYTGLDRWVNRKTIAPLFIIPVLATLAAFTNDWHHLIWSDVVYSVPEHIYIYVHGPLYWVISGYSFVLLGIATLVLARFAVHNINLFRYQSVGIIIAILIPWIFEIVYDFQPTLIRGLDGSAVLAVSSVILTVCIVRFRLLDLVPVARDAMVESMKDGLMVLDCLGRIVDCNPACRQLIGLPSSGGIGEPATKAAAAWPRLRELLASIRCGYDKEQTVLSPDSRHINVRVSTLSDRDGKPRGFIVILRDVSHIKETERELQMTASDLQARLSEIEGLQAELREQAIRDPLTTLFNRRYLDETLQREFARAKREGYPISLVMLDIDGFKQVNDTFGHAAGDLILRAAGELLRAKTRPGDFACRYGGDEFLVVLPNIRLHDAASRSREWRAAFERLSVSLHGYDISVTVSIGVAGRPEHGELDGAVLTAADDAVYLAKAQGRNRVVVAPERTGETGSAIRYTA